MCVFLLHIANQVLVIVKILLHFVLLIVPGRHTITEGSQIGSSDMFNRSRLFLSAFFLSRPGLVS